MPGAIVSDMQDPTVKWSNVLEKAGKNSKLKGSLKPLDGSSILVRMRDVQVTDLSQTLMKEKPDVHLFPSKMQKSMTYYEKKVNAEKKLCSQFVPKGMSELAFEETINEMFAENVKISHYDLGEIAEKRKKEVKERKSLSKAKAKEKSQKNNKKKKKKKKKGDGAGDEGAEKEGKKKNKKKKKDDDDD